ncbi:hypothetical protein STEG23_018766, partial [Scotinomys teguina]
MTHSCLDYDAYLQGECMGVHKYHNIYMEVRGQLSMSYLSFHHVNLRDQTQRVPRTGWLYRNLENPESVSDLIYQMAIMAMGDQTQPSQQELRVSQRVCKYRNVEKSESVSNPMYRMAIMAMVPRDYNHNKN